MNTKLNMLFGGFLLHQVFVCVLSHTYTNIYKPDLLKIGYYSSTTVSPTVYAFSGDALLV